MTPSLAERVPNNGLTDTEFGFKYESVHTHEDLRKKASAFKFPGHESSPQEIEESQNDKLSAEVKIMSQKFRKFNGHLDLIDSVSQRTAEMIHQHILTQAALEEEADVIGEKNLTTKRRSDVSPPRIFMEKSLKFNKSSPIKDLSFFDNEVAIKQGSFGERARNTVAPVDRTAVMRHFLRSDSVEQNHTSKSRIYSTIGSQMN